MIGQEGQTRLCVCVDGRDGRRMRRALGRKPSRPNSVRMKNWRPRSSLRRAILRYDLRSHVNANLIPLLLWRLSGGSYYISFFKCRCPAVSRLPSSFCLRTWHNDDGSPNCSHNAGGRHLPPLFSGCQVPTQLSPPPSNRSCSSAMPYQSIVTLSA